MANWKDELELATRRARAKIIGAKLIDHAWHGKLVRVAIDAFGDDARATFFIESLPPAGDIPRPDLILLHPEIGLLVIENKGIELGNIHGVEGTTLTLDRDHRLKQEDPFKQAEKVMYRLKDFGNQWFDVDDALFLRTAALPRIRRGEFELRFKTQWPAETLFADACVDAREFRKQVLAYSDVGQRSAHKVHRLTKRTHDNIMTILTGRSLFYSPRRTFITATDPNLLGVQIQDMELALKEPTQQQKDLGTADLRGTHRLFRGVAGSGKSIMLALNVAQTLLNFKNEQPSLFGGDPPRRRVLALCFNRTLVFHLRQKIEDQYGRSAWDTPPEEMLTVTHFEGLVRQIENKHPAMATGLDYKKKEERAKGMCAAFDKLGQSAKNSVVYDAIFVDEAQDLLPAEFEFLVRLARKESDGKQTLVIFYDNAQNIYAVTAPTWDKLGINILGGRTVYLDKCLRNTTQTLAFAFNVLVGSFAPEGQRVTTRQFADVASLKQRGLIAENGDRYDIHFSPRAGPAPVVSVYPHRRAEIEGVVESIQHLVTKEKVLPSDILVLYKSHYIFDETLIEKVQNVIGPDYKIRMVDSEHFKGKYHRLIEDGVMTFSTIASAKGYDAPVVFLLGADDLGTDSQGRASFYVGATRTKLSLYVSGVKQSKQSLLDEIVLAAETLTGRNRLAPLSPTVATKLPPETKPPVMTAAAKECGRPKKVCRHCGSEHLHAQYGKFSYFYRCIACTNNTPIDATCPKCRKKGQIRKSQLQFFRECVPCGLSELIHCNVPLDTL